MTRSVLFRSGLLWLLGLATLPAEAAEITVFAAASLTKVLTVLGQGYEKANDTKVILSFAGSSALAKQIEQGAPADIFISADTKWMDYLDSKGKIDHGTRMNLLGNSLVLIAPKGKAFPVKTDRGFDFASAFTGNLCTGQTESVPVGMYAKEALTSLGWWEAIKQRIVGTEDVKASLNLVERGECDAGIVYRTDAMGNEKVEVVSAIPENLHSPIVYPVALVTQLEAAAEFVHYLQGPDAAKAFTAHGFTLLSANPK